MVTSNWRRQDDGLTVAGIRPAADADTWIHHIIQGKAIRETEPRVKAKYVEDRIDEVRGDPERSWEGEISGRLLSACDDIEGFAAAKAASIGGPPSFKLRAVAAVQVAKLRAHGFDVHLDPVPDDHAHAVLTIPRMERIIAKDGGDPAISQELVRRLADLLTAHVGDDGVRRLQASRGTGMA